MNRITDSWSQQRWGDWAKGWCDRARSAVNAQIPRAEEVLAQTVPVQTEHTGTTVILIEPRRPTFFDWGSSHTENNHTIINNFNDSDSDNENIKSNKSGRKPKGEGSKRDTVVIIAGITIVATAIFALGRVFSDLKTSKKNVQIANECRENRDVIHLVAQSVREIEMRRTSKLEGYSTTLIGTAASGAAFVLSGSFSTHLPDSVALVSLTASIALGLYTMGVHWDDQFLDNQEYALLAAQRLFSDAAIDSAVRKRILTEPYQEYIVNENG